MRKNNFLDCLSRSLSYFSRICSLLLLLLPIDLLLTLSCLYVTRLPSGTLKLWGFSSWIRLFSAHPSTSKTNQERLTHRILLLDSDLLSSSSKTPSTPPHISLHSIANAIQFQRREGKGGIDRRMEFEIPFWRSIKKRIENRIQWHVGNHSDRFYIYSYLSAVITHEFLELFFTHIFLARERPVSLPAYWNFPRVIKLPYA